MKDNLELAKQRLKEYTVTAVFYEHGKLMAWVKEELFPVEVK